MADSSTAKHGHHAFDFETLNCQMLKDLLIALPLLQNVWKKGLKNCSKSSLLTNCWVSSSICGLERHVKVFGNVLSLELQICFIESNRDRWAILSPFPFFYTDFKFHLSALSDPRWILFMQLKFRV